MSTANGALGGPAPASGGLPNSGALGAHPVWCVRSSASDEAHRPSHSRPDGAFSPTPLGIP